jgi:hypothetical protein
VKKRSAKWSVVCRPKDHGRLGIQDLEVKNTTFLGKWIFRLLTEDRTGFGKLFLEENISAQKIYHRFFFGNLVIHTFGPNSWQQRSIFLAIESFRLRMDPRYVSRRISG